MSFWKFNFAAAPVDNIASILARLPPSNPTFDPNDPNSIAVENHNLILTGAMNKESNSGPQASPASTQDSASSSSFAAASIEPTLYDTTLDSLLATPDLLSELKTGNNPKLVEFMARSEVVARLGGWVAWGLGRRQSSLVASTSERGKSSNGGLVPDELEDGKVPDDFVRDEDQAQRFGMGRVVRRRDMDSMGVLEGGEEETEEEKSWAVFPRLCTEILSSDSPSLSDILFNPAAITSEPHTCPSASEFLLPFWETLLSSTETQLETRSAQVGYWTRVNATLLNGEYKHQVLAHILTIPHLLPRLLALLPYCSPLNDLLLLLLRVSTPASTLVPSVITQSIRMLDPFSALGKEGHLAAEDLLRGCIELGSATPALPSPQNGPGPPGVQQELELEWRDNSLTRRIADEKTVRTLLDWVLPTDPGTKNALPRLQSRKSFMTAAINEDVSPSADAEGAASVEATPKPTPVELYSGTPEHQADLRTSSLIASIAVLVDLIRKNNSDFVEQHMLTWARRKEAEQAEREMLEAQGAELVEGFEKRPEHEGEGGDRGPPVVDLTAMLATVSDRIGGLQRLVKAPRSAKGPIASTVGPIHPVTLERFRICEFYAELLHCSNMGLLNRPVGSTQLYDQNGYLARGWQAADELAEALQGTFVPDEDYEFENYRFGKERAAPPSTSPIDVPGLGGTSYSGTSTPSAQGSLDSESGILTREEARELRELIASAGGVDEDSSDVSDRGDSDDDDDEGTDPFDDPHPNEDDDLVAATSAIDLDDNLNARESAETDGNHAKPRVSIDGGLSTPERDAEDDPTTPCAPSVAPLPRLYSPRTSPRRQAWPPGPMLKRKFLEHDVIETMLDMFFQYPWNNLIHNVTFDLLQQIFHGRIDRALDRQLALSVFLDGRLIDRILEGHEVNEQSERTHRRRLGYMGHMILIAEEIVKLFEHYHDEIYQIVEPHVPQPAWDRYVSTTLRETRERDLSPLGGGVANAMHDTSSTTSALSDEDDEFPMNSSRAMRAMETNTAGGGAATMEEGGGLFGGAHGLAATNAEIAEAGSHDQFSRYLANAITADRSDKFGSSDEDEDEDEDDAGWMRTSSNADPGQGDFALGELNRPPKQFGFDDRFESTGRQIFQTSTSDSDDDGDWGGFTTADAASASAPSSATTKANELLNEDFRPTVAASSMAAAASGFGSSYTDSFGDNFAPSPAVPSSREEDDDDFGDFEAATTTPSITLPSLEDALEDFDFGEEGRRVELNAAAGNPNLDAPASESSTPAFGGASRPGIDRRNTANHDGSASFGSISTPTIENSPLPTPDGLPATPPTKSSRSSIASPPVSPGLQADLATSEEEPLGHGMARSAHLTDDGLVEVISEVDGKTIRVPADDIVLAHRRTSMDGNAERPKDL